MTVTFDSKFAVNPIISLIQNIKSLTEVKKDLAKQECIAIIKKINPNLIIGTSLENILGNQLSKVYAVKYEDGRIFYKMGNTFYTSDAQKEFLLGLNEKFDDKYKKLSDEVRQYKN